MANDEMPTERERAEEKFAQAQKSYARSRWPQAEQLAQEALDIDKSYNEARRWLAELYREMDEPHKASREYQNALRLAPDDQQAWEGLERVDPASAARLRRLSTIAPDPFVAQRRATAADLIEPLAEMGVGEDELVEPAGGLSGIGEETSEEMIARDEIGETVQEAAPAPPPWEFEQDREFLQRWLAEPVVETMADTIQGLWAEPDVFVSVLALCAHGSEKLHPQFFAALNQAAQSAKTEPPQLYILPERSLHPVLIKDGPALLAVPTRVVQIMTELELVFVMGRQLGHLRSGYLAALQAVEVITERKPQLFGDCADTLREVLADQLDPWQAELEAETLNRLKKLGHAWQQRAVLSADRAGLLCCHDIQAAATAIAKGATPDIDQAGRMNLEEFLSQFEGQDPGQLAAIPVQEAPWRTAAYGAYRIQMLQWWSTTAQFADLREM